ncbi:MULTISPECIES: TniQ family protein [unclassified Mesorhizobium]|uniref:TniQ family protein n=1 Tax=unclassified Mesorhizobium TaxID=325217 RepID=UPI0030156889
MTPQLPINMTVPIGRGELPSSFASRTAFVNRRSARDFCLDMGFKFQDVVDGKPEALARLAHCGRSVVDVLDRSAFRRVEARLFEFNGEIISRSGLLRGRVRACASCLMADMEQIQCESEARPYQRAHWLIGHIRTCPHHDEALIDVAHDLAPNGLHDFTKMVIPVLPSLAALRESSARRKPSTLEHYLLSRLNMGSHTPNWLDRFRLDAVGKLCEMLGVVDAHGVRVRLNDLTEDQFFEAGTRGFEIASQGEADIRELLANLQRRQDPAKKAAGPKSAFYRLYEWLAHESEDAAFDPLRDVVARHCIETMPLGPGDELFGKPVHQRRLHSIHTASREYGTHPKRLRKLLHLAGYLSDEANSQVDDHALFNAEAAHEFIERAIDALTFKEAANYLNVPRPHDVSLLDSRYVTPIVDADRQTLNHYAFDRDRLDSFLKLLLSEASVLAPGEDGFVGILEAGKRACCGVMEIVDLIMDKKLKVRTSPSERGFLSAMVDLSELRSLVRLEDHGGMSLRQAEKSLGVTTGVLKALVMHGHLPSRVEVNPINRCPQTVIDPADMTIFKTTYVSLMQLAEETGIHFNRLKMELVGIPLAMDRDLIGSRFYHRSSIPPL